MIDLNRGTRIQQDAQRDYRQRRNDLMDAEAGRQAGYQRDARQGAEDALGAFANGQTNINSAQRSARQDAMGAMANGPVPKIAGGTGPLTSFMSAIRQGADADLAVQADAMSRGQGLSEALSAMSRSAQRGATSASDAMSAARDSFGLIGNEIDNAYMENQKRLGLGELMRQLAFGERAAKMQDAIGSAQRRRAEEAYAQQQMVADERLAGIVEQLRTQQQGNQEIGNYFRSVVESMGGR